MRQTKNQTGCGNIRGVSLVSHAGKVSAPLDHRPPPEHDRYAEEPTLSDCGYKVLQVYLMSLDRAWTGLDAPRLLSLVAVSKKSKEKKALLVQTIHTRLYEVFLVEGATGGRHIIQRHSTRSAQQGNRGSAALTPVARDSEGTSLFWCCPPTLGRVYAMQ